MSNDDIDAGRILAFGGGANCQETDVATALHAHPGGSRLDFQTETFITHSLRGEGFDASEDGTGRGTPLVPVAYSTKLHNTTSNQAGKFYENYTASLDANSPPPAVAFAQNQRDEVRMMDVAGALAAEPGAKQQTYVAFAHQAGGTQTTLGYDPDAGTVQTLSVNQTPAIAGMQVRRLTPRECERLQGFPDDYTLIPITKWQPIKGQPAVVKMAADGPRYKALGNSWAVPNVRWIGERIAMVDALAGKERIAA